MTTITRRACIEATPSPNGQQLRIQARAQQPEVWLVVLGFAAIIVLALILGQAIAATDTAGWYASNMSN